MRFVWFRVLRRRLIYLNFTVAQMSSKYLWTDVRLISFDLQTVEFTYSADYSVSLTCTDELSSNRSSYHLRFSRVIPDNDMHPPPSDPNAMQVDAPLTPILTNPHEDAEPFLCALLGHGKLSVALYRLVSLLRETLPVVAELEEIRAAAARAGEPLDTFAKSASWFRVLYGDLRHALDFRLMANARVAVLDASHTFCEDAGGPGVGVKRAPAPAKRDPWALQPIPDFRALVADAVKAAREQHVGGCFASIDVGVVCDVASVRTIGHLLHQRVQAKLGPVRPGAAPAA